MTKPSAPSITRAYSRGARARVILITGVVPALIAMLGTVLMLSWASDLPDPIAVHWGPSGGPDGYGSLAEPIAVLLGCVLVFSAAVTFGLATLKAAPRSSQQIRVLSAASVWMSGFLTIGITGSVAAQRGLADATATGPVGVLMLIGAGVGLVLGVAAWFLTPLPELAGEADGTPQAALKLAPHERASWSRAVRPATKTVVLFCLIFGVGSLGSLVIAALTVSPSLWWMVLFVALVLAAAGVCFYWRISIDNRGVTVRAGAGFPRVQIPLDSIAGARLVQVSPLGDFGGWGWRWSGNRTGIVVRAGEALEITRTSGKVLVVTVDDAATAASLLEGMVHRSGATAPGATA